jgi:hypothetical protein
MSQHQTQRASTFLSDCERIHHEWHMHIKAWDTEGLLALYAADAVSAQQANERGHCHSHVNPR